MLIELEPWRVELQARPVERDQEVSCELTGKVITSIPESSCWHSCLATPVFEPRLPRRGESNAALDFDAWA